MSALNKESLYSVFPELKVNDLNKELASINEQLKVILKTGLERDPAIDLDKIKHNFENDDWERQLRSLHTPIVPEAIAPIVIDFRPPQQSFFGKLIPGSKRRQQQRMNLAESNYNWALANANAAAEANYNKALADYDKALNEFETQKLQLEKGQARYVAEKKQLWAKIDAIKNGLSMGDSGAIVTYIEMVLQHSPYPKGYPKEARVAYVKESKQIVVELRVPTIEDAIPQHERMRYIKSQNSIVGMAKSEKLRHSLYSNCVAQIVLRTVFEILASDRSNVEVVAISAFVNSIDPGTGKDISPFLVSLRVARSEFIELNLDSVEPSACLKRLNASVSRSPAELVAIKPIIDFKMVDPRFIGEQDILTTLDTRPNLMELSPSEFESLITNLFQSMGLETKLTQASRDGGVDCVAFDSRPVLGGKVIVQAKRYKNTVGVSAVRDLFGTVHNEGASKGILVTTSGFGKAAYTFANQKPLELITGSNLLYLLQEYAGVNAKIEPPEDWIDPKGDIGD